MNAQTDFPNFSKVLLKPETRVPLAALAFASLVSVALVIARMAWTMKFGYSFLVWNLFLAWLPLVFSLLACDAYQRGRMNWRFAGFGVAWLLFLPNAPYILTDLTHLRTRLQGSYWVDLILILSCAVTGLVLGFVSLFLMQSVVRRICGMIGSWLFVAAVTGLSGFGICLGRFLRFNSWDVVVQPFALCQKLLWLASHSVSYPKAAVIPVLFGAFLLITYLMFYALTHLPSLHNLHSSTASDRPNGGAEA